MSVHFRLLNTTWNFHKLLFSMFCCSISTLNLNFLDGTFWSMSQDNTSVLCFTNTVLSNFYKLHFILNIWIKIEINFTNAFSRFHCFRKLENCLCSIHTYLAKLAATMGTNKKNRFISQHLMTMLKMKLPKLKIPFLKHQHKVS